MPTGLGHYSLNLVQGLAALDQENEYILLTNPSYTEQIIDQSNFREIALGGDISSVQSVSTAARTINRLEPDVYHALMHFVPFGLECPWVLTTLHDLNWVETPELSFTSRAKALYNQQVKGRFIKFAVNRADVVLAISGATRQRAIEVLKVPPAKCRLVYLGVEQRALGDNHAGTEPSPQVADLVESCEQYVFTLGHSKPYKNVDGVMRAFALIKERHSNVKLFIVGRGDRYPALKQLAKDLNLGDQVAFCSSLTPADVHHLFAHAAFLAHPSFVEGFGLPIIEAMALGCPVLTSNVSAPGEIAGEAAFLVSPYDINEIAAGMQRMLTDHTLRQSLVVKGRRRAAEFTIERCARATHALYLQNRMHTGV